MRVVPCQINTTHQRGVKNAACKLSMDKKHIVYIKGACFHFFLWGSLALPWPVALCLTACNTEEPRGLEQQRGRCKRYPWWAREVVLSSLWSPCHTGVAWKDCKDAAERAWGLALGSEGFKARKKKNLGCLQEHWTPSMCLALRRRDDPGFSHRLSPSQLPPCESRSWWEPCGDQLLANGNPVGSPGWKCFEKKQGGGIMRNTGTWGNSNTTAQNLLRCHK